MTPALKTDTGVGSQTADATPAGRGMVGDAAADRVEATAVESPWQVDRDDVVCVLRFAGGRRRTLGIAGAAQLAGMLADLAARPEPPVLVLDVGILHAELLEVLEMSAGRPIADWQPWLAAITGLERYPSATIVAIQDQASCGGLELSLAADIRIVAPNARLGVLEARMGLVPGAGGTQRLSALLGHGHAALLCFSGLPVSGTEAYRIGLAQLLADDPVSAATDMALELAQRGFPVLAAAKRALLAALPMTDAGFRTEGKSFLSVVGTESSIATMRAWLDRQAADDPPSRDPSSLP
jgi:enoyl-CoA hydratase/carnithine racemase